MRIEAARSLGSFGTQASAVALAGMLDDPYLAVRVRVASDEWIASPVNGMIERSAVELYRADKLWF